MKNRGPSLPKIGRSVKYLKPEKFHDWLTLSEMARAVNTDPSWLRRLEKRGTIPKAKRVTRGQLEVRLWPPRAVNEIQTILDGLKPGRPRNG